MEPNPEKMERSGKDKLKELEAEGKYLFHGSGLKLDVLEPRQAYNYPTKGMKDRTPDGEPAVFASGDVDVAIFMAVVNKQNAPKKLRSGFSGLKDGKFQLRATKETMDQIKDAKGFVYVFDRDKFRQIGVSNEYATREPVQPIEIIEVSEKDLPDNIEIKDF